MTDTISPVTPTQAFAQGMTLDDYMSLGHGREHNARLAEFRALCVREIAARVPAATAPVTREHLALVFAAIYAANVGYSMNADAQREAQAAADAVAALGGTVFTGRGL